MKRRLESLEAREYDVLIVGGGITGACLAYDAATRGLSVAIIDKGDFGGATSAASSKLLHGGLRYLQQLRFGKVRESAQERIYFQNLAPHLSHYVPFVVPTYQGIAKSKALLGAGMLAYEALCIGHADLLLDRERRVPPGRGLSAAEVSALIPGIDAEGLTGGRLFYESHMLSSERMTLAFVDGAVAAGATAANYVEAREFLGDTDTVRGVRAVDVEGGAPLSIRARVVINAAGPWIGQLNEHLPRGEHRGLLTGYSRGAHLVTRPLTDGHAVALPTRRRSDTVIDRGGRHIFVIPWRGHSLIGTSYGPHEGSLDAVYPTRGEIEELIADVNAALGQDALTLADVQHAFAGLYPLTADDIDPAVYQGSSDYRVVDHGAAGGTSGLFTVFGAKFTTARLLAERALDQVTRTLEGDWRPCQTRESALPSAPEVAATPPPLPGIPEAMREDIQAQYGAYASALAVLAGEVPDGCDEIASGRGTWAAMAVWAAREEMARHLDDVVFRRTGLGTLGNPGEPVLRQVADLMGGELHWDAARRDAEVTRTLGLFAW